MAARRHNYRQTCIGACGHVCEEWPQVSGIGGSNPTVICDTCTRQQYGIPENERLGVWVNIKEEKPTVSKPAKPKAKKLKCFLCGKSGHLYTECSLMSGQGTLDGS